MKKLIKTDQLLMGDKNRIKTVISGFWDRISLGWQQVWGPHIHHGYYENEERTTEPLEAQETLIVKLAEMLELQPQASILDAGCGMGGTSLFLARKFSSTVMGISLSRKQVSMAREQADLQSIRGVEFRVEDAVSLESFENDSFDVVWSLESCEQFYDKNQFIQQAFRVLKPGGKLMLATWCSDSDEYAGKLAKKYRKLCLAFDLPYMPAMDFYERSIQQNGFRLMKTADWSGFVKSSWARGISLLNAYSLFQVLKISGMRGLRFIKQIRLMRNAFEEGWVRYGVFIASKKSG